MKVYAESSAVLAWLFDEREGQSVVDVLAVAETIVVSELTMVECRRVIHRALSSGGLTQRETTGLLAALGTASVHWMRSAITQEILDVASGRFSVEPVRTLDAIHLATAVRTRRAVPDLRILTVDQRIRNNGEAMGFVVVPD